MIAFLLAPVTAHAVPASTITSFNTPRFIFLLFAGLTVIGALSTIMRKNDIAAVMSLVATFFGLAAIYTFLSAHFIAVLQVLVYAGAIMVLFIFVVMVLNRDETDPWVWRGVVGKTLFGVVPIGLVTWVLVERYTKVVTVRPEAPNEEFGTIAQIGELLFTDYLFAFEAVSVLLLIAVIAAVVVSRTHKHEEHASGAAADPGHRYGDPHTGNLPHPGAAPVTGGGHH